MLQQEARSSLDLGEVVAAPEAPPVPSPEVGAEPRCGLREKLGAVPEAFCCSLDGRRLGHDVKRCNYSI